MKLSNVFIVTILAAFIFTGCKENNAKKLIVKKWKFTEISGPDAGLIPDTMKKEMYRTATMEFKNDGTYEQAGGLKNKIQKGTYSLGADGKSIISKHDGADKTDTVVILELTESKMVVTPKTRSTGKDIQLTMKPN
jgi:hypothetical protein